MSRFDAELRLTLRAMLVIALVGCDVIAEPIFSVDSAIPPDDGGLGDGSGPDIALTSRILVADGEGLIGFDFIGQEAPFGNALRWDGVASAVVGFDVLAVARPGAIAFFDDATDLSPDRVPTRELNEVELGGPLGAVDEMRFDSNGTLWVNHAGDVRAFFRASMRLPDGNFSAAVFEDGELNGFAYDAASDRLFAGPGDGGQVLVWDDALTRESIGPSSFALGGDCAVTAMVLEGRVYAACADGRIAVYSTPSGLTAGALPMAEFRSAGQVRDLHFNGALYATGDNGVDVWRAPAAGMMNPDVHIDVPGRRALSDDEGTLFVLNATDVQVVQNAATDPEVIGAVRTERAPLDIAQY